MWQQCSGGDLRGRRNGLVWRLSFLGLVLYADIWRSLITGVQAPALRRERQEAALPLIVQARYLLCGAWPVGCCCSSILQRWDGWDWSFHYLDVIMGLLLFSFNHLSASVRSIYDLWETETTTGRKRWKETHVLSDFSTRFVLSSQYEHRSSTLPQQQRYVFA